jgi:hypothetical protein
MHCRVLTVPAVCLAVAVLVSACGTDAFNFSTARLEPNAAGPWVKEGVSDARKERDLRECWTVARAQAARDQRIDQDIDATDGGSGSAQGSLELKRSMEEFGYARRREQVVAECMREKGYTRR